MLTIVAWIATAAILLTYALTVRNPGDKRMLCRFHLANAVGFVPLALLNLLAGTWPALIVNVGFGLPAVWAVTAEWRHRWQQRKVTPEQRAASFQRMLAAEMASLAADLDEVSGVSGISKTREELRGIQAHADAIEEVRSWHERRVGEIYTVPSSGPGGDHLVQNQACGSGCGMVLPIKVGNRVGRCGNCGGRF